MPNTPSTGFHPATPDTILITGGTSIVGRAVLAELDRRPTRVGGRRLVGSSSAPRTTAPQQHADSSLRAVVHVASVSAAPAINELTMPELHIALELAERSGVPIYLVSSAFSCDQRAVSAVRASGLPHVVLRPSLLIGSCRTGVGPNARALTRFLDAAVTRQLPDVHFQDRLVDLVPSNLVAEAIIALIADSCADGEYWLTSGDWAFAATAVRDAARAFAEERDIEIDLEPADPRVMPGDAELGWLPVLPMDTSLGNRFQNSIGELGGLGVSALPDQSDLLGIAMRSWELIRPSWLSRSFVA